MASLITTEGVTAHSGNQLIELFIEMSDMQRVSMSLMSDID